MATYVMSDIHGRKDKFEKILASIGFSERDMLYILGDVIDRGPDGIKIIQIIRNMHNVRMLLGNHEYMMIKSFGFTDFAKVRNWIQNGGIPTMEEFDNLEPEEQEEILQWLRKLPTHLAVEVNGKHYFLVHGWPGNDTFGEVWGRPSSLNDKSLLVGDSKIIIGHTPVSFLQYETIEEQRKVFQEMKHSGEYMKILHTSHFIDLDCGCGYPVPGALACLRLDDFQEFYV